MLDPKVNAPRDAINGETMISDPWRETFSVPTSSPQVWRPTVEPHPLIAAAGVTGADQLTAGNPSPAQLSSAAVLLQDELKLPVSQNQQLCQQIEKALTLLWWAEDQPS
uniref:Uncharacterized protein n=1 Tax=Cyanothece sp. (strain PCC 7425 / ATCC 29141) TaxID=395961 RepID=B8HJQ8_CYAP4